MNALRLLALGMLAAATSALATGNAEPATKKHDGAAYGQEGMRALAGNLGCTLCHRESVAAREGMPLAPSWEEIAARYRGRRDAEQKLTRVVIEGSDPGDRHWRNRVEFTSMGANAPRITPDEARALVRWILSGP